MHRNWKVLLFLLTVDMEEISFHFFFIYFKKSPLLGSFFVCVHTKLTVGEFKKKNH